MSVATAHAFSDQLVEFGKARSIELGVPVTCRGLHCFGCCKEPMLITKMEVEHALETYPPEQLEALRERTKHWLRIVKASGILKDTEENAFFYRQCNLWCPFLVEGTCSVYDRRPTACRTHLAIGDPEKCVDDFARLTQKFLMFNGRAHTDTYMHLVEGKEVVQDHDWLACWLVEILLGVPCRSGVRIEFTTKIDGDDMILTAKKQ